MYLLESQNTSFMFFFRIKSRPFDFCAIALSEEI